MKSNSYSRICRILNLMEESDDISFTSRTVRIDRKHKYTVECIRFDASDNLYDENDNLIYKREGKPTYYEVYYWIDEKEFDCCTVYDIESELESLLEFVEMYEWKGV